jgi:hypothetical protein
MGWRQVDEKSKEVGFTAKHVECEDGDLPKIKQAIKQEFPDLDDAQVDQALRECCDEVAVPRLRNLFLGCLQNKLGGA